MASLMIDIRIRIISVTTSQASYQVACPMSLSKMEVCSLFLSSFTSLIFALLVGILALAPVASDLESNVGDIAQSPSALGADTAEEPAPSSNDTSMDPSHRYSSSTSTPRRDRILATIAVSPRPFNASFDRASITSLSSTLAGGPSITSTSSTSTLIEDTASPNALKAELTVGQESEQLLLEPIDEETESLLSKNSLDDHSSDDNADELSLSKPDIVVEDGGMFALLRSTFLSG